MNCTKAIIIIAGYGTRRLPITKSIEKSMLPILNRPVVDYVVEDCIKAGITDIYFVVNKDAVQIRSYYGHNKVLEDYLAGHKKQGKIKSILPPKDVTFHYVEQDTAVDAPYGTAVPVWMCRKFIQPDEHVLVLTGDDFIFNADGSSEVKRLIKAAGNASALLGVEVPETQISSYGVIVAHEADGRILYDHIQEKPSIEDAQSNLINVSKYVLPATFFDYLETLMQGSRNPSEEYYIIDALNAFVHDGNEVRVVQAQGEYLDGGTVENWLYANQYIAGHINDF